MKDKLATSWEIYNQIIWNPKLNAQMFRVGFADRMAKSGIREKPLLEWANESDIPWHRIRYFRCGEVIVWDRTQRIDLFAQKALPIEAWLPEENIAAVIPEAITNFTPQNIWHFGNGNWQVCRDEVTNQEVPQLKVVTYNVLCDEHEKTYVRSAERYAAIVQYLQTLDADIIALQEATPLLLQLLLQQTWAQQYYISEAPQAPGLRPFGQVILSKYLFSLVEHLYSPQKRFLVAGWQFNDTPFHLANIHLTSNRSTKATTVRQEQLAVMTNYLNTLLSDVLLVGDYNMRGDDDTTLLKNYHFEDVWELQHPDQEGFSFDPTQNPLAEKMSLSGLPGRLDRMYLRSQDAHWMPQSIGLFGQEPIANDYLRASDHYGLLATYAWTALFQVGKGVSEETLEQIQTVTPTYQSAIVLVPPQEIWKPIQKIRAKYDQKMERWMPHITLVYGFIPEALFEAALPLLAQALQQLRPFEITLEDFQYFEHRKSTTAWLRPVPQFAQALQQLQDVLQPLFPQCHEQTSRATGFVPHLSVGQFDSPEEAQKLLPDWSPITFLADKIALISRQKDTPFDIKYSVYLGQKPLENTAKISLMAWAKQRMPRISGAATKKRSQALHLLEEICSKILNHPIQLQVFGSELLGVATANSDIDVLCPIPAAMAFSDFYDQLQLSLANLAQAIQLVSDARISTLKFTLQEISFDLLAIQTPYFPVPLAQVKPSDFNQFDAASWQGLAGYLEAKQIQHLVRQNVGMTLFRDLTTIIRLWASRKQLTGNVFGFFSNISWAILAAWSCNKFSTNHGIAGKDITCEDLLKNFFELLTQHDWQKPISLQSAGLNYTVRKHRDWMPVTSAIHPYKNTTRNLTRSTAKTIRYEINKAHDLLQKASIDWEVFFAPTDIMDYKHLLVLELEASQSQDLLLAQGKLEGSLLGVILGLEQQLQAEVRPATLVKKDGLKSKIILGLRLLQNTPRGSIEEFVGEFTYDHGAKLRVYLEG